MPSNQHWCITVPIQEIILCVKVLCNFHQVFLVTDIMHHSMLYTEDQPITIMKLFSTIFTLKQFYLVDSNYLSKDMHEHMCMYVHNCLCLTNISHCVPLLGVCILLGRFISIRGRCLLFVSCQL